MAMGAYGLTQYNPAKVDQQRTQNRLRSLQADQAEMQMDRQNRLMELLGGGSQGGGQQQQAGQQNAVRNAALDAGGGPSKQAANMLQQAGDMPAQVGQTGNMDQRKIMEVMALDPQLGGKMMQMRQAQSEQQRAAEDREAAVIARGADRIDSLPEGQRTQAWQAYKQKAAERGYDVSDWPDEYDPNAMTLARSRAQAADMYEPPEQGGQTERFTVKEGGQEVTYIGNPADRSTWQKVASAPRWEPDTGSSSVTSFDTYQNATNRPIQVGGKKLEPGETITLDERNPDDVSLLRQNRTALRPAPSRREQGEPGEFRPTDPGRRVANLLGMQGGRDQLKAEGVTVPGGTRLRKLESQRGSSVSLIRNTRRIASQIRGRPELTGLSGDIISSLNSLRAEVEGFAQAAGVEIDAPKSVESYSDTFSEIGVENARLQSAIINAAYTLATSREEGRLSESDVRNAIKSLGTNSDPQAFAATLTDVARRVDERFRDQAEASLGKRPPSLMMEMEEDVFGAPIEEMDAGKLRQMIEGGQVTETDLQLLSRDQLQNLREKIKPSDGGGPPARSAR